MISKDQASIVLRKNVENIVQKAAAGTILTKGELDLLKDSVAPDVEPEEADNWSDLARRLKIARKTVWELRKDINSPDGMNIGEWRDYLEDRASGNAHWTSEGFSDAEIRELRAKLLSAQAGREEANRKLKEIELRQVESDIVSMDTARDAIKNVMLPLRSALDNLPKAAAIRVNPSDPAFAEAALRECIDDIYRTMEQAYKDASKSK
jgi:hypothetical protein